MKRRSRILIISATFLLLLGAGFVTRPPSTSFGQQNYPESNRKPACGCYVCGLLLAVNFPGMAPPRCFGILATDACPVEMAKLPVEQRKAFCKALKARSKDGNMDSCLNLRGACDGVDGDDDDDTPPETKCEKPAPWFDRSTSCTDVQSPLTEVKGNAITVSMCGFQIFRAVPQHSDDPGLLEAYRRVVRDWVQQKVGGKVCCSSMRNASRTGKPCDPAADIDCDGKPNQSDIDTTYVTGGPVPDINLSTSPIGPDIDPFPPGLDPNDPNFRPERTGRNSKGVGECDCKWELIKGDMKCSRGLRPHVYTATWRCPSTKAEVFTTKRFPGSTPCK
ncbi:MAG: hypothetical protein ABI857_06975 [Acidobacteriota bacterium]